MKLEALIEKGDATSQLVRAALNILYWVADKITHDMLYYST